MSNDTNEKVSNMTLNKLSISLISVLITVAIALGSFAYKTGVYNNEVKNIKQMGIACKTEYKESILILKEDFRLQILEVKEVKADKVVVELMLKQMSEQHIQNQASHKDISDKLDRLIENKVGDK
jgi:uncharacterized protein with FMN-binding domain